MVIGVASVSIGAYSLGRNVSDGNWSAAAVDLGGLVLDGVAMAVPLVPAAAGLTIQATRAGSSAAKGLPDSALVCRGGSCTADKFANGSGVTIDASGKLNGVSVNSATGRTLKELAAGIPHNKIGVTTVGDIRKAGGNVIPSPTKQNPNHATLQGITPQQAQDLMTPTVRNPSTR
ncbi:hypothetical protein D9M68_726270 [compost metagenome]